MDTARCTKCAVAYHRVCVGLPTKGPLVSAWHCPECRKNVRRDNKAETPVRGCVAEVQSEEPASMLMPTPPAVATLEPETPTAAPPTTPLTAPLTPRTIATPPSPVVVEVRKQVFTPPPSVTVAVDDTSLNVVPEIPQDVGSALKMVVEELRTLRFEVLELRKDVAELKASNDSCHTRMDGIESRLEALEKHHAAGCDPTTNLIQQLKRDINDRDQELMANDLVIGNIPESQAENPTHLFQLIATKLGVALDDRDIVSAERVGGRHIKATSPIASTEPRPRAIMVRLARRDQRDAVLNGARVRRDATTENLGLSGKPVRIFVNERLTRQNQQLFRQTRAAAGIHGWRFVWTKRGRILVRQKPGESTHRIASEEDIKKFIGPYTDTDTNT